MNRRMTRRDLAAFGTCTVGFAMALAGCGRLTSGKKKKDDAGADARVPEVPTDPVAGPASRFEVSIDGPWRVIRANGIPNHVHGQFPNAHDPEAIKEQSFEFRVPLFPVKASAPSGLDPIGEQTLAFGIAVSGVTFDPSGPWYPSQGAYDWHFDATSELGSLYLGLDVQHAHTQAGGRYHYHGVPGALIELLHKSTPSGMLFLGYAADGFPIYAPTVPQDPASLASPMIEARSSYRLRTGERPSAPGGAFDGTFVQDFEYVAGSGDLDECNGREGPTPEYPDGTYYYVLTNAFPFVPRLLRGVGDRSFFYGPKGRAATAEAPGTPGGARAPLPIELRQYKPKETP